MALRRVEEESWTINCDGCGSSTGPKATELAARSGAAALGIAATIVGLQPKWLCKACLDKCFADAWERLNRP